MPRFDWRDRDEARREEDRRRRWRGDDRDDFGLADYSSEYAYDPQARRGYRTDDRGLRADDDRADYSRDWAHDAERGPYRPEMSEEARYRRERDRYRDARDADERLEPEPRSWMDRAGAFLTGDRDYEGRGERRRRGPSDRVLWAVIVERLEDERGLDLSDVDVIVDDAEVTLNGTVRRKEDKRRIEDIADLRGVHHVQNNLRVRDRGHWTFL
jgi:hypothetical protein